MRYSILILLFLCFSCSNENAPENPDVGQTEVDESLQLLTSGGIKAWRIQSAVLENTSTDASLDILALSNVEDDVFIFSTEIQDNPELSNENGSVIWQQREAINWSATSIQQIYKDYYEERKVYGLEISETDTNTFRAFEGLYDFEILDENNIQGIIQVESDVRLVLTLSPRTNADLPNIPDSLDFTKLLSIPIDGPSTIGLTASAEENQLFIANRPDDPLCANDINLRKERFIVYYIDENTIQPIDKCQPSGFVTKELEVINGNLISISSDSVNKYDLSLNNEADVYVHTEDVRFSRHGTATYQNSIYVVGGDIQAEENNILSDRIFKFDLDTNTLDFFTHLPSEKFYSDAEIVNDKLYVFGGNSEGLSNSSNSEDDIYVYDFNSDDWESLNMPYPVLDTFTGRYQNLIIIGGSTPFDSNNDGMFDSSLDVIGVFNTEDNSFSSVETNFDVEYEGIFRQLTVLNGKIYLLTGPDESDYYNLYVADL